MTSTPELILASASPRRRELMAYMGAPFRSVATDAEEQDIPLPPDVAALLPTLDVPMRHHPTMLAWRKASAACMEAPSGVIIGADTIVVLDGDVLNKPVDAAEARLMLRRLAGRTHIVYTGMIVIDQRQPGAPQLLCDAVASSVQIAPLADATISDYVATGEPMDKAGAYGIQGLGGRLVTSVEGSYTNVVGLPLATLHRLLAAAGFQNLADPTEAYHRWLSAHRKEPLPCPPTFP